jgi:diadenosine tetraphosphate (Ap4A) HIT family hydrolase
MGKLENCTFCDPAKVGDRIIYDEDPDFYSFISDPWFRPDHCLIVPREHADEMYEIPERVLGKMMAEAALLAHAISTDGTGTFITQKFQPRKEEGRIKQNHVHVHGWRRLESDSEDVPFITPVTFERNTEGGFWFPSDEEVVASRDRVIALAEPLRARRQRALYSCATQKMHAFDDF